MKDTTDVKNRAQTARQSDGFATGTALIAIFTCFLVLGGLMTLAATQFNLTGRSLNRTRATLLAEAGVEHAMNALSNNWNITQGTGTLYEDPGTNLKSAGTFSYTTAVISASRKLITSTATEPTGRTATVVGTAEYVAGDTVTLSRYALLAQAAINFGGNSTISSNPINQHNADARTNGDISQGGSSYIDGTLYAVGTIGGAGYYPNQPGASEITFPDELQLQEWETDWRAESKSAGRIYTPVNAPAVIAAPAYIGGSISLNGKKTLTITGSGIVFIEGSLSLNAQTIVTNSATLVVRDGFTCNGQAYYTIPATMLTPSVGFTATMINLYGDMQLNGGGDATGIVFNARGNMRVNGGAVYKGALISGGTIDTVGSYNQFYSGNMKSNISFPISLRISKIVEP